MKRRNLILGLAAGAGFGAGLARPTAQGDGGHDAYFSTLSRILQEQGLARPTMIVDLDRLDHNIAELRRSVEPDRAYRVVAKSLPSLELLLYCMRQAQTRRLMVFHQPFLNHIAHHFPDTDLLLGKPMPVAAAARFYARHQPNAFETARQLRWLIDTPERLQQYRTLAEQSRQKMLISVELDVGLHRGGLRDPAELPPLLEMMTASPYLEFGGFMGYEPHVAKAPTLFGMQARSFATAVGTYEGFLQVWREHSGGEGEQNLNLNAAGSPTFRYWEGVDGVANEMAAGTGLVKPTDYDIPTLETHQPALFIGTPVLKASQGIAMPVVPALGKWQQLWNPNRAQTFFVYGGYWKARPVSPPGLVENGLYGHSTNQEMLNGSRKVTLKVDDHVFYRPTQSEFVMLQFGDLLAVRGDQVVAHWPVLSNSDAAPA